MAKKEEQSTSFLTFRVTPEFKKEFKIYAVSRGITMIELLERSFEALKRAEKTAK